MLALDTLYFADEIRDPHELGSLPGRKKARGKQFDMATALIDAMSGPWQPTDYRDTYTAKVHKLIEDKRKGKGIVTESEAPEATPSWPRSPRPCCAGPNPRPRWPPPRTLSGIPAVDRT